MIQINIPMPESCTKCPFFNDEYETCPLAPMVPAMQNDIRNSVDKRWKFCPLRLREVPEEEHFKLEIPEKCGECKSMIPYGNYGENHYCHINTFSPENSQQDISTIFVYPESRPDWCPMIKMNNTLEIMSPDRREAFDKIASGLSALFGSIQMMGKE